MAASGHSGSPICAKNNRVFHYVLSMAMPNMKLIGEFMTQLEMPQAFWAFLYKMAARGHFVFPIDAKNHRVLVIWDLNGYDEYEFDGCIYDKVMTCTRVGVRRRRRRRRNQKHNITDIFKFRGYNYTDIVQSEMYGHGEEGRIIQIYYRVICMGTGKKVELYRYSTEWNVWARGRR